MDRGDEEPKETRSISYGILFWILIAGLAALTIHPVHRAIVRPPVTEQQSLATGSHATPKERAPDQGRPDTKPVTASTYPVTDPATQAGSGQMAANLAQP